MDKHIVERESPPGTDTWWNAGEFIGSRAYSEALAFAKTETWKTGGRHRVVQHLVRDIIEPSAPQERRP